MKAKKMIVPILMGVLMAFAILPMTVGKAYAEDYNLWVGGTQVKSDNASNILGNGTASYNATSKTLTLNGATITMTGDVTLIESEIPDLTIEVKGENKLLGGFIGIGSSRDFTITGDGSLEAEASDFGIVSVLGGVTIKDATVTTGTRTYSSGIFASGGIRIEGNSKVQANGGEKAIYSVSNIITIGDDLAITEPANGRISDDGQKIVDQKGDIATSVTIEPLVEYDLWVGGTQVTNANAGDVLKDGKVKFKPANGDTPATLTLNNATITGAYDSRNILSNIPNLTIEVKGENKLSGGTYGIYSFENFSITGNGSLQVEGSSGGILSERNVTIDGTTVTAAATGNGSTGIYARNEVKIEGSSKVHAEGKSYAFYSNSGQITKEGLAITEPANGRISDDGHKIVDQKGQTATSVTIEPLVEYDLWVGGTKVTNANAGDVLKDGKVKFDPASGDTPATLTLDSATITGVYDGRNIISKIQDLTINVKGKNSLSGGSVGIEADYPITITGEGSLQAEGSTVGIVSHPTITITNTTVTATGELDGIYSEGTVKIEGSSDVAATGTGSSGKGINSAGKVRIEGSSKVQAKGNENAIYCNNGITIGDGLAITEPVNGRVEGKYIVDQKGDAATSVTIERVVKMNGDGTADSPYQIKTYEDLKEFASIVNGKHQAPQNTAACGKLMNDITCDDKEWVPISDDGTYAGTFDGNHKVIYDLSNEETGAGKNNQGLFGKIVKGEVKNVGIVGGKIIGKYYVGAVVGYNIGTMTNCYNTGSVSGLGYVGGVAGTLAQGPGARGTITNCYNTGSVSGSQGVGGLVGYNGSQIAGGTITNCYNVGSVSGSKYVGGVAGTNSGAINNCYYNKELNVVKAIGDGSAGTNVEGLETSQMVGAAALNNMTFSYKSPSENPWLTKEDGKDADSGTYYEYYPHLKGFAYDISKKAADWPGKLTTSAEWSDDAVSYDYNGSAQGPKVTKVITSPKPVEIPDGMTAQWRKKIVEDVDNPEWGVPINDEPSLPGVYKLTIKDPKDGDKVIEEIVYIILKKKNSSNSNDYNVKYQVQKKTAGGGTEWSDIDSKDIVDVGNYKAVIELTGRPDLEEKEFQIAKAPLTITTAPTASAITYGHKLNDSKLTGGVAKDGDAEVAGTFTWDEPDTIPAVSDSDLTEYDVTFTPDDTVIYDPQPMKVTVPVNKAKLTITAISYSLSYNGEMQGPGDKTYNDAAEIAEVVKVEGLQGSDALTSVEVDGQGQTPGGYPLIPNAAAVNKDGTGTGNYKIKYVNGTLTIEKVKPKITTAPKASDITYGQTLKDSSLTGGLVKDGDTVVPGTFKWDNTDTAPAVSDSNKTEYDVTFTPTDTANYEPAACTATLTVNKADITPSVSIEGWTYGSKANKPSVEGNPGGGDVTFQYKKTGEPDSAYAETVPTDAGTYTVKAEVAETRNYNGGEATLDFTISPADMQVTSAGYSGAYDGGAHSITVNAPEGAEVLYAGPGGSFSEENPAFTDAGTYAVDFRVRLENYNEYAGTETVEIRQAPNSVDVSIKGWTYGEPAQLPTVTADFGAKKAVLSYSDKPDGTYRQGGPDQAGIWYVKAAVPETADYAGAESKPFAFEIAKAAITIKADDKSSKYGASLAPLTYKVGGGYVEGDDLGVTLSTDAKKDKAGTYAIRVRWNENPNYAATLTDGAYTVGKKPAPKPQPKINKAAAKIALDAGLKAYASEDKVTASWGAVKGASSYEVYASYCDRKDYSKVRTVSGKITSIDITKLAGRKLNTKKNLKLYVVAYKTVKGKKVKVARSILVHAPGSRNSKRTNVTTVKVKKDKYTLKEGQTRRIKAKRVLQDPDKKPLKHTSKFRYASSNTKVAKVSKKGKITAVGKGKCTIYVYSVSGNAKKIKVTVK